MNKTIITFLCVYVLCISSCKDHKPTTNHYNSKINLKYKLQKIDSLICINNEENYVGTIKDINTWNNSIIISDLSNKTVGIYSMNLEFIGFIGKSGRGPGEFTFAPNIIPGKENLFLIDFQLKTINKYDRKRNLINTAYLPSEFTYFPFDCNIIDNKFLFAGSRPFPGDMSEYYSEFNTVVVLDKDLNYLNDFLKWDEYYSKISAHSFYNIGVLFATCDNNTFFAIQRAVNKIYRYNINFERIASFGVLPKFYKQPSEDMKIEDVRKSSDSRAQFFSSITQFFDFEYDIENQLLLLNYVNETKDSWYNQDLLSADNYLIVYNNNYDCVFDEKIPGRLCFVYEGIIYILIKESPKLIQLNKYELVEN